MSRLFCVRTLPAGSVLLAVLAVLVGCGTERYSDEKDNRDVDGGSSPSDFPDAGSDFGDPNPRSALVPVEECDDLRPLLEDRLLDLINAAIDRAENRMIDIVRWGCYDYDDENDSPPVVDGDADGDGDPSEGDADSDTADDHSTTNTQVAGVDEADFIKNDDGYIYILADGKLQIIDAWPAHQSKRIAKIEIDGNPKKLYVHEDTAVVYSSLGLLESGNEIPDPPPEVPDGGTDESQYMDNECTYGYDCEFTGDGKVLQMTVIDLQDRSAPRVLRKAVLSGAYLNSRRIGDIVHTVVVFPDPTALPGVSIWPFEFEQYRGECPEPSGDLPFDEEDVTGAFYELRALVETKLRETLDENMSAFLPKLRDTRILEDGTETFAGVLTGCENFYLSKAGDGASYLGLTSFDLAKNGDLNATVILGKPGVVYATAESLYVAVRHYSNQMDDWYFEDETENTEATTVHKFGLESGGTGSSYRGSGLVTGRILNQFSMDEYKEHLRIATTTGRVPSPDVHSTLTTLAEADGVLKTVGVLDGIAPTEDIRSVRFDDDLGFIVTFKKTDPLFVIDLADPAKMTIKGELKIPGFSTYMHLMDDSHLLTIGYDADDQGSFAWFTGIQLQIIDVTDLNDPRLMHKEVIGTRGSTSEAATNHLAFNYYPTRDLLALPMVVCKDSNGEGSYGMRMDFSGLLVYETTVGNGFDEIGGIPHEASETDYSYQSGCNNWWTDSHSKVQRSVFMEDFVYSIAPDRINVAQLIDLEHSIASVELVEE